MKNIMPLYIIPIGHRSITCNNHGTEICVSYLFILSFPHFFELLELTSLRERHRPSGDFTLGILQEDHRHHRRPEVDADQIADR